MTDELHINSSSWSSNCLIGPTMIINVPSCFYSCVFSGPPAHAPKLSFSVALTVPMERTGTILFDKVFVNEGNFYDPRTGKSSNRSTICTERNIGMLPQVNLKA